jgi:WhiB family redox-sensing transcriptional regulator
VTATAVWVSDGLCAQTDPEAFYPEKGKSPESARGVCRRCPVQPECLEWALDSNQQYGVWGGTTAKQRQRMRRARRNG